jgi:hypothetical protein
LDPVLSNILQIPLADFRPPQPDVSLNASVYLCRIDALIGRESPSLALQIIEPALMICVQDDHIVPPYLSVALHEAFMRRMLHMMQYDGRFCMQRRAELI